MIERKVSIMKKKLTAVMLCLILCMCFAGCAMARTVTFGSAGYEELRWQVLYESSSSAVLLSQECIACRPFGSGSSWGSSSLRSWLNSTYLYSAFTAGERRAILPVEGDMIRIPSVGDMTNTRFGFSSSRDAHDRTRSARGSSAAINQGLWTRDDGRCSYYTLTPCDRTSLYQVRTDGRIGVARADRDNVGVRIIIKVDSSALQ